MSGGMITGVKLRNHLEVPWARWYNQFFAGKQYEAGGLFRGGGVFVGGASEAEYVAEIASGPLGTEYKSFLLGLPALPVPNSPVPLPEAALYRTVEQTGIVKLIIFVHSEGQFVSLAHYYAKVDRDESFFLWYRFQERDDIRTGWEQADLHLAERFEEPAGQVERAADGPELAP